jgi:hypothetical protein
MTASLRCLQQPSLQALNDAAAAQHAVHKLCETQRNAALSRATRIVKFFIYCLFAGGAGRGMAVVRIVGIGTAMFRL